MLEPDADINKIKLKYNVSVEIQGDGSLRFRHPSEKGYFSEGAPKAWQDIEGKRTQVEVAFADYGDNTIGFRLGQYNRKYPVVIDPIYEWHTFYGSGSDDIGYGIAVDTSGNVYVTGYSFFTWGTPLNAFSGGYEIVVLKLSGLATHFTVSAPASATAGTAFFYTVTALDASNNTATGYAGTVHFTSSDRASTLPANSTLTNGVGTFSATLRTAGNQTISVADTGNASITGSSGVVAVVASVPTAVPTMTEWGMMAFMILAAAGSVYYLRRRQTPQA